jgi:hypothetical protein
MANTKTTITLAERIADFIRILLIVTVAALCFKFSIEAFRDGTLFLSGLYLIAFFFMLLESLAINFKYWVKNVSLALREKCKRCAND